MCIRDRLALGDPPHGADVSPLSPVAAAGGRFAVRTRHRYLPRDDTRLVESLRSNVRQRDQKTSYSDSIIFALALAPGRGLRQDQWRDTLSLACGHEGEVLEVFVTKRRDRMAALKFLKRAMKRYGRPKAIVTDRLRSYGAALKVIGIVERQECGRWLNNRAENSHQPFRRREGAMTKFRDIKTLQKFAAAHASIHNHFNHDRHLNGRHIFKQNRSAALAEWRQLAA